MNRLALVTIVVAVFAVTVAFSRQGANTTAEVVNPFGVKPGEKNPWTHLEVNTNADKFDFVVISDRTGGHREKIFSRAVHQINLLQPDFVVSVGDLIEGYSTDIEKIKPQWDEFDSYVKKLKMPFFYVPGNHDVTNKQQVAYYGERYGKRYYHFTYKNVLFLALDSEDTAASTIAVDQQEYAKKALADNPDVRWTIVLIHKPIWTGTDLKKNGWEPIETALAGRKYTVFCGHVHHYQRYIRNGMDYLQLATTGGGSRLRGLPYGEFDQLAKVTMTKEGPVIANILLEGVLPVDLSSFPSDEKGSVQKKVPVYVSKGRVLLNGKPLSNAVVTFTQEGMEAGRRPISADGITDDEGKFQLTTYSKFDGCPEGNFKVTVTANKRRPGGLVIEDKDLPKLPAAFTTVATTPLKMAITKDGPNDFVVELK